jgi:hypothetical protein
MGRGKQDELCLGGWGERNELSSVWVDGERETGHDSVRGISGHKWVQYFGQFALFWVIEEPRSVKAG